LIGVEFPAFPVAPGISPILSENRHSPAKTKAKSVCCGKIPVAARNGNFRMLTGNQIGRAGNRSSPGVVSQRRRTTLARTTISSISSKNPKRVTLQRDFALYRADRLGDPRRYPSRRAARPKHRALNLIKPSTSRWLLRGFSKAPPRRATMRDTYSSDPALGRLAERHRKHAPVFPLPHTDRSLRSCRNGRSPPQLLPNHDPAMIGWNAPSTQLGLGGVVGSVASAAWFGIPACRRQPEHSVQ
jgi:hypothetical protein